MLTQTLVHVSRRVNPAIISIPRLSVIDTLEELGFSCDQWHSLAVSLNRVALMFPPFKFYILARRINSFFRVRAKMNPSKIPD